MYLLGYGRNNPIQPLDPKPVGTNINVIQRHILRIYTNFSLSGCPSYPLTFKPRFLPRTLNFEAFSTLTLVSVWYCMYTNIFVCNIEIWLILKFES